MSTDANGAESHSHGGVRHTHAHGHSAHADDYALPSLPEAVDIFDTILRDGISKRASPSRSTTSSGSRSSSITSGSPTSREAGPVPTPRTSSSSPRQEGADARDGHAGRLRLHAAGRGQARARRRAGQSGGGRSASRLHRRQGVGPPRCRGAAHVARRGRGNGGRLRALPPATRPPCLSRCGAFLRRLSRQLRLRALGPRRGRRGGRRRARPVRHERGTLPDDVGQAVADVARPHQHPARHPLPQRRRLRRGQFARRRAGRATQVQGCINGYGERAGNTDLSAAIPNLSLKLDVRTIPADRLERLTPVAHHIAELVNIAPNPQQPYVGTRCSPTREACTPAPWRCSADLYEHVDPNLVGNGTRVVVSEMAGRSTLAMKAAELGLELDGEVIGRVLDELKRLEHEGYHFEVADGISGAPPPPRHRMGRGLLHGGVPSGSSPTMASGATRKGAGASTATRCSASRPRQRSRSTWERSASSPWPRATDRSTRSTAPCGAPSAPSSPRWTTST